MMRVLICDDEVNVCRLLISLINWDALDLELVGLAHTGPEALQKIQDLLPQIVITDVRIPVFDGLELVSRTQALGIHTSTTRSAMVLSTISSSRSTAKS